MEIWLFYMILGACAGLLSGLLGIGGGVIVVPGLWFAFQYQGFDFGLPVAVGTSLSAMVLTAASSVAAHYRNGHVHANVWRLITPGMMAGSFIGVAALDTLSGPILNTCFASFLALLSLKMILKPEGASIESVNIWPMWVYIICSIGLGCLSGLLGIGGGILLVPFLLRQGFSMRQASGTAIACAWPTVLIGACMAAGFGHDDVSHDWAIGYVFWPATLSVGMMGVLFAPLGTRLAKKLPTALVKRIFGIILVLVAWKMMGI